MKISYNWLKTLLPIDLSAEETATLLTASGLEVEGIERFESIRGGLKGLVIGKVIACEKHPGADKLHITKVDIGADHPLSIVCGAPNVSSGQTVLVATVGTRLYPSDGDVIEIKKSKIRGEQSEGMLCAEDEAGLGRSHEGIMVLPSDLKPGTAAADHFQVEIDQIFEIGLTPNRSDAASHLGVARELFAILNSRQPGAVQDVVFPAMPELPVSDQLSKIKISIEEPEGCRRYCGLVLSGLSVKESPAWLKNRLLSIGLRPINNVVDATNFVMHELGQPLHAFDLQAIHGNEVIVRRAKDQEAFTTLDGVKRSLVPGDLVIADAGAPMCLAGVFGGLTSGVTQHSTSIFLESAYFNAGYIRRSSKHHGLKTDASFRFERGTDPEMTLPALKRAAGLILQLAGGSLSMDVQDIYPQPLEPCKVAFSYHHCNELIGKELDKQTIRQIITNLGMKIETEGNDGLLLSIPLYKTDVTREADVIEEILRVYGYNNVEESKHIQYSAAQQTGKNDNDLQEKVADLLSAWGFNETMGLSLDSSAGHNNNERLVRLLNPLSSDLDVLRPDLLHGALRMVSHNLNRKNGDLKLFEFGKVYEKAESAYVEKRQLSLLVTGKLFPPNPYGLKQDNGFSFLKGCLEVLLKKCGVEKPRLQESELDSYQGMLQFISVSGEVARLGKVAAQVLKRADIHQDVFYAVVDWDKLLKLALRHSTGYTELVKFPSVKRDLALLIPRNIRYQQIEELAFSTEKKYLRHVNLFDVYEGEKLGNRKSYAVSFTLQNSEATLTDKQIETVMDKLITAYREKLGAELR